jgi:hypothetical protein
MFPAEEAVRFIEFNGVRRTLLLGDTVWWFPDAAIHAKPHAARIMGFNENDMLELEISSHTQPPRLSAQIGVCLVGDQRLANPNYRKRGAWMPRWTEQELLG